MTKQVQRELFAQLREKYFKEIGEGELKLRFQKTLDSYLKNQKGVWAAYCAMGCEADVSAVVESNPHIQWVFPKVKNSDLCFFKPATMADFSKSDWGILEPVEEKSQAIPNNEISGFLIPAVALDRFGNRLGMGKGFYDRALSDVAATKVAVAYEVQLSQAPLPLESHDIRMDFIATDLNWIEIATSQTERTAL